MKSAFDGVTESIRNLGRVLNGESESDSFEKPPLVERVQYVPRKIAYGIKIFILYLTLLIIAASLITAVVLFIVNKSVWEPLFCMAIAYFATLINGKVG